MTTQNKHGIAITEWRNLRIGIIPATDDKKRFDFLVGEAFKMGASIVFPGNRTSQVTEPTN